jgi:hypothetical protein
MIKAIREIAGPNHAHDMDDLSADRTLGFARRRGSRFQIHLKSAFCSKGAISVC